MSLGSVLGHKACRDRGFLGIPADTKFEKFIPHGLCMTLEGSVAVCMGIMLDMDFKRQEYRISGVFKVTCRTCVVLNFRAGGAVGVQHFGCFRLRGATGALNLKFEGFLFNLRAAYRFKQ